MAAKVKAKTKVTAKKAPPPKLERAAGKQFWLIKTEPEVFSFADLEKAPNKTSHWDGVRNYQARNYMRDLMKVGDGVLVYHSNAEPPAIAGIAEVSRAGYPDHTQFDAKHDHYDPKAKRDEPTWYMFDVKAVRPLKRPLPLPELREAPGLKGMVLIQKGSRLSVQPVRPDEWNLIVRLGGG